ncbi:MAG: hypothetical protein QXM53_00810 [Thermofilaceae archaeon]
MNDIASFRTWVWETLRNATGLQVYSEIAPETAKFPFIRFSLPGVREWPSFVERSGVQIGLFTVDVFSSHEVSAQAEGILAQVINALDRKVFVGTEARYLLGLTNIRLHWEKDGQYWMASADFSLHRFGNA